MTPPPLDSAQIDALEIELIKSADDAMPRDPNTGDRRSRDDVENDVRRQMNAIRQDLGFRIIISPRPVATTIVAAPNVRADHPGSP